MPGCSGRGRTPVSGCCVRSSSPSAASRSRRTSPPSCRSTFPAPRSWSARARRATNWPRLCPKAIFLGPKHGEELARIYAAADVFVFPSRTDTFGLVLLEALACGTPVAGFPVAATRDVVGNAPVAALDEDLRAACLSALALPRAACREYAESMSWDESARCFLDNVAQAGILTTAPSAIHAMTPAHEN